MLLSNNEAMKYIAVAELSGYDTVNCPENAHLVAYQVDEAYRLNNIL